MPIRHALDDDLALFVFRFTGRVTERDLLDAVGAVEAAAGTGPSRSLLVFEPTVDLSELSPEVLQAVNVRMKALYRRLGVRRRAGAAVLDGSPDAHMIVPLWNALFEADPELEQHYEMFDAVAPAAAWLGVPTEACEALVARTKADPA